MFVASLPKDKEATTKEVLAKVKAPVSDIQKI
jgi:hypothetical protein